MCIQKILNLFLFKIHNNLRVFRLNSIVKSNLNHSRLRKVEMRISNICPIMIQMISGYKLKIRNQLWIQFIRNQVNIPTSLHSHMLRSKTIQICNQLRQKEIFSSKIQLCKTSSNISQCSQMNLNSNYISKEVVKHNYRIIRIFLPIKIILWISFSIQIQLIFHSFIQSLIFWNPSRTLNYVSSFATDINWLINWADTSFPLQPPTLHWHSNQPI